MATIAAAPPRVARPRLLRLPLRLNPVNQRRLANFKANRRGYVSLHVFLLLFGLSLFAECVANDRPFLIYYDGGIYLPFLTAWAVGSTFATSVTAANVAGVPSGWDQAAAAWFLSRGATDKAANVDSQRLTSGSTGVTIGTMP